MNSRRILLLVASFVSLGLLGCASHRPQAQLSRFEFETPQMGVPFRIILYAADTNAASKAAKAAFARLSQLNEIMSDYEYDSELSRLGRTVNQRVPISPELWTVFQRSREISRASHGAFDVTVGPMIQLWRKARREQKLPPPDALDRARARTGYTNLVLKEKTAELKVADMRLDLGAIAKGYAADEALRILRQHGITRALCAASSDMALGDAPPGEKGWKVQLVGSGDERGQAFLILSNCGVATSGDLSQFVEIEGKRYSHIVDPKTGLGLVDRALITVVARNGITADGLSTAVTVMPQGEGLKVARKFGAEARETRILPNDARVDSSTSGFWKNAMWLK